MEELDALLEERLQTASSNEKKLLETDVPEAISNIDRICSDSIHEIEKKSRQIVDMVSSWVETATAEFHNETEAARQQIKALVEDGSNQRTIDMLTSMISETSYLSANRISRCAEVSINKIRTETSKSILELRTNAANAFKDFRALAAKATNKIKMAVEKAALRFKSAKSSSDPQASLEQLKKETNIAVAEAESASAELENAKIRTIERINDAVNAASLRIEQAHLDAAKEIKIAKERAELKLKEISDDAIFRFVKT